MKNELGSLSHADKKLKTLCCHRVLVGRGGVHSLGGGDDSPLLPLPLPLHPLAFEPASDPDTSSGRTKRLSGTFSETVLASKEPGRFQRLILNCATCIESQAMAVLLGEDEESTYCIGNPFKFVMKILATSKLYLLCERAAALR